MSEKKPKPLFFSTPRGDKSQFDDFWKIKRSELKDFANKYRDTMRSTLNVEKPLRQRS